MHSHQRGGHRRALALQGGLPHRPRLRRQAGLAPPAHGLAARGVGRHRVRGGRQARHLPGPGLRVHAQGRRQGPARGRDAARLRLPHPHRRRPRVHRRQGQQPPRAARLQAQERRHRRDRHHQERPRSVARLAQHRHHEPRQGEDPAVVQAPAARREHRPRQASRSTGSCAAWPARRSTRSATTSSRSSPTRRTSPTLDDFYAAIGYGAISAQQVVTRLGVADDSDESVLPQVAPPAPPRTGGIRVKGVGDLLVRFSKCCHPIPGDPIVGFITRGRGVTVHQQTCHTVVNEQRPRPAHRGRVGDRRPADLSHRHPHRGVRPDGAAVRHQQRRGRRPRSTSSRRTCPSSPTTGDRPGHAPGHLGRAAGAGDAAARAAPGRVLGPARRQLRTAQAAVSTPKSHHPPATPAWLRR